MTNRGERRHHERRVAKSRTRRFPFYVAPYAGKTPGKICSCPGCGNQRAHEGPPPSDRRRLQDAVADDRDPYEEDFVEYYPDDDGDPFDYVWLAWDDAVMQLSCCHGENDCGEPLCRVHGRESCRRPDGSCDGSCDGLGDPYR